MIAMIIGLFVLSGILSLMTNNLAFNKTAMNTLTLNQEAKYAMEIMADDIRRAGYWNNSNSMVGNATLSNPYSYPNWPITIYGGNCITFSYDRDGTSDTPSSSERFGYALVNNSITLGYPTTKDDCTDPSAWQAITNTNIIKITGLTFTLINPTNTTGSNAHQFAISGSNDYLCVREVKIAITAELLKDPTIKTNLEKTIRVRNDEIRRSPATSCA
jgi:type II secretory pathway component PulJ